VEGVVRVKDYVIGGHDLFFIEPFISGHEQQKKPQTQPKVPTHHILPVPHQLIDIEKVVVTVVQW
jgi:hypothetical protein